MWRGSRSKDWRLELQEEVELDMEEVDLDCERVAGFFLDILVFRGFLNQLITLLRILVIFTILAFLLGQPDTRCVQVSS